MDPISRRGFVGTVGATVGAACLPYVPTFATANVEPGRMVAITFAVNETWTRMPAADLIRAFEQSLA